MWLGLCSPFSLDFPDEAQLLKTKKMLDMLTSSGAFMNDVELQKKEKLLKKLESLYKEWLSEMCFEMNVQEVDGKISPFGSYQMGVHSKGHRIYSHMLGFMGGVWSILVARVCQVYPLATTSTLVANFFQIFSMWEWPQAVRQKPAEDSSFGFPTWDHQVNVGDRLHIMPTVTPAFNQYQAGPVQDKLGFLLVLLERNAPQSCVHLKPESMPLNITDNIKVGKSTMRLMGLVCGPYSEHLKVVLTSALRPVLQPFVDMVSKQYEAAMSMTLISVRRGQLHWVMPGGGRRAVHAPQQGQGSSAGRTAMKRRGHSQMKHPAKRAKAGEAGGKDNSCDRVLGESSAPDKSSSSSSSSSPTVLHEPLTPALADEGSEAKVASRKRPATPELHDATGDLAKPNAAVKRSIPLKLRKHTVNTHIQSV